MNTKTKTAYLMALLPLVIAVLVMAPRLASPQFGVMDDGLIYTEVQKIREGDLSMGYDLQAGRFRPLYWLYFTLIYTLAGSNPVWFFVGHLVILMILLIEIRSLMKSMRATDGAILLAQLVFLFSIPIIENFYTLSKGDPLSLVFILASLISFEKLKSTSRTTARVAYLALAFINGLFAIWAKETAYIMAPISAVWAGYALLRRKIYPKWKVQAYGLYFAAMAGAMGAFFLIRAAVGAPPVTGGTFTERYIFTWEAIFSRIPRWMTLFASYYHYLVPLAAMAGLILISKQRISPDDELDFFAWGLWLLAWVGALMPWEYARAYYLLAFSLGVSILVGLIAPYIRNLTQNPKPWIRRASLALTALFALLFLASLTHYRTHARAQLIFDLMNHEMLQIATQVTPEDGRVFVSLEEKKEYVEGIEYFLVDFYGLTEIEYTHIDVEALERLHWYPGGVVLMPTIENMPRLLVRAGVDEKFTMLWNEIVLRNQGDRFVPVAQVHDRFRVINLNLPVMACPLIGPTGYCEDPDPFFDTRVFSYGWNIFTIR